LDSSLCSSDNEILSLPKNKKRNKLKKKSRVIEEFEDLAENIPESNIANLNKNNFENKEDIEIEGEIDNFISQNNMSTDPSKSLAHVIFSRENHEEEKKRFKKKQKKLEECEKELHYEGLEDQYLTKNDQNIVATDIPERIVLRYLNK